MRRSLTKRVWQFHSWLGLICGLALVVIGLTGSLLVFRDEIDALRFPSLYRVEPADAGRLSYDALWATLRRSVPSRKIVGWTPARRPEETDAVYISHPNEDEPRALHFDPYSGELRGRAFNGDHTFFGWLLKLHYSFFGGQVGVCVAGVFGVMLLLLGASGVWLYRGFWRNFFTLRWGRSARIYCSDLHKMVGISSTVFNLIVGFTGAWWNLTASWTVWTTPAAPIAAAPAPLVEALEFLPGAMSLDALVLRAQKELPGFRATYMFFPTERKGSIVFYGTVPTPNPLRGDYGSRVTFDASDGKLQGVADIRKAGAWEKIGDSFVLLHYGTFGAVLGPVAGFLVKVAWTILGLAPGVLAISGFLIWRSRRRVRAK